MGDWSLRFEVNDNGDNLPLTSRVEIRSGIQYIYERRGTTNLGSHDILLFIYLWAVKGPTTKKVLTPPITTQEIQLGPLTQF